VLSSRYPRRRSPAGPTPGFFILGNLPPRPSPGLPGSAAAVQGGEHLAIHPTAHQLPHRRPRPPWLYFAPRQHQRWRTIGAPAAGSDDGRGRARWRSRWDRRPASLTTAVTWTVCNPGREATAPRRTAIHRIFTATDMAVACPVYLFSATTPSPSQNDPAARESSAIRTAPLVSISRRR
jgi:hypothetical protein